MKIVTIAGSGRTGSTLLSLLLTQGAGTFNMGQLRDFWGAYARNEACTCGSCLQACPIWSDVVREVFGVSPHAAIQKVEERQMAFVQSASKVSSWGDATALAALSNLHADYLHDIRNVVRSIASIKNVNTLIDTSKSPEIGLAFSQLPEVELRVLNLIRDPRAVASSWLRKRDEQMALQQSRAWLARQTRLEQWSDILGNRKFVLRYEDFSTSPRTLVRQVLGWAGLGSDVSYFASESLAELSWSGQHLYPPANETVIVEKRTSINIVESTGWRNEGHKKLHERVEKIVHPMLNQFGYGSPTQQQPASLTVLPSAIHPEPSYVFLICSERSGSNLITAILNSHPDIGAPPPYHLCRDVGLSWHALIGAERGNAVWAELENAVCQRLTRMRSPEAARIFSNWLSKRETPSFGELARQVFCELSGLTGKRIIFIKENNIHRQLFFILQHFPSAKFVFQVRDPRDFLLSAINRKGGAFGNKFGSSLRALEVWREDQLGGLAALAHLGQERVFFQRYEDLVSNPESVLEALCGFLDVPYDRAMIDFYKTEYASGLAVPGGPRENLVRPLMTENFLKYREGLSLEQVRMVEIYLKDLMARFSYDLDYPDVSMANRYELFWPMFLEPIERAVNGETAPFYTDGASTLLTALGHPLQRSYV